MDLVLDIGNFRLKGAFFEGNEVIVGFFTCPLVLEDLKSHIFGKPIEKILISSVNPSFEAEVISLLPQAEKIELSGIKVILDVDEPDQVGHDRIANVYGALFRFPQNNCIVVDMGTAITFDYVGCDGRYIGGAICPGLDISAQALNRYTKLLPLVPIDKPPSPIAKTTTTHIQAGLYWGLLGAIERITFEMRASSPTPSDVKVIATGGLLEKLSHTDFAQDLRDIVDLIDPALTLIGLNEIMKEKKKNV